MKGSWYAGILIVLSSDGPPALPDHAVSLSHGPAAQVVRRSTRRSRFLRTSRNLDRLVERRTTCAARPCGFAEPWPARRRCLQIGAAYGGDVGALLRPRTTCAQRRIV